MYGRVCLAASCLALSLAVSGCALLGMEPVAEYGAAEQTVEPTMTMMAVIPTAPVETKIVSDGSQNVVATVKASDSLSTMGELLDAAGMAQPISNGKNTFTLFVPTNYAFERLPADWLPKLKDPANVEKLRRLLRYHLVKASVPSQQMYNIRRVMTYEGGILMISQKDSAGYVNGKVRIQQPDVRAKNGTIHVVDAVLVPPGFQP